MSSKAAPHFGGLCLKRGAAQSCGPLYCTRCGGRRGTSGAAEEEEGERAPQQQQQQGALVGPVGKEHTSAETGSPAGLVAATHMGRWGELLIGRGLRGCAVLPPQAHSCTEVPLLTAHQAAASAARPLRTRTPPPATLLDSAE